MPRARRARRDWWRALQNKDIPMMAEVNIYQDILGQEQDTLGQEQDTLGQEQDDG